MKRREFASMAVAGMAVAGGALVSGAVSGKEEGAGEVHSTTSIRGAAFKRDTFYFLTGTSRVADASTQFNEDGGSVDLLADYTSSGVSLVAFYKDGTGVAFGLSRSRLLRTWDGSDEKSDIEKTRFGYLFSYNIGKNGLIEIILTDNSYKARVLSGPRKGEFFTVSAVGDGDYLKGLISGKELRLYTYPFQQVKVDGQSRFKLKSKRILGDMVSRNFVSNLPDFQIVPKGLLEAYRSLL